MRGEWVPVQRAGDTISISEKSDFHGTSWHTGQFPVDWSCIYAYSAGASTVLESMKLVLGSVAPLVWYT